ncbi:Spy/CpxP family protein refolding chaperone [Planctomycetota bacterium]
MNAYLKHIVVSVFMIFGLSVVWCGAQAEDARKAQQSVRSARGNDPITRLATAIKALDLTDEQVRELNRIATQGQAAMLEADQAHSEATRALNRLAARNGSDADIMAAAREVGKTLGIRTIHRVKLQNALQDLLTPEQQQQLKESRRRARPASQTKEKSERQEAAREGKKKAKKKQESLD